MEVPAGDVALSQSELAISFEVTRGSVRGWVDHKTWPFPKESPWSISRVARWHAQNVAKPDGPAPDPADVDPAAICRAEAERRRAVETAATLRIKRLALEGEFIHRQIANDALISWSHIVRGKIEEMIESLAPLLCPDDPAFARKILRDWYDRLCEDLAAMTLIDLTTVAATNGRAKNPDKVKAVRKRHSGKGK